MGNDGIEPKAREKRILNHQYRYLKTNKHNQYSTLAPSHRLVKKEIIVAKQKKLGCYDIMFTYHNNLIIKAVICNYIDCNQQVSKTNNPTFIVKFNV
jgi:hypothetical protein